MEEVKKMPEARGRFVVMVSDCQSAIVKIISTMHDSANSVRVRRAVEDWEWGVVLAWVPSHVGYAMHRMKEPTSQQGMVPTGKMVQVFRCLW
jgi:hypothetical protein